MKNAILEPDDQFHVGIVATDFEATVTRLTEVFGYEWGPEVGGPVTVDLPGGTAADLDLRCVYSITVPRLEVVRSIADTLWDPAGTAGVHHIGYWSDDVAADVEALIGHGYLAEATRPGAQGGLFFAFLRSADGFRVELVDRAAESGLSRCWAAPEVSGGVA